MFNKIKLAMPENPALPEQPVKPPGFRRFGRKLYVAIALVAMVLVAGVSDFAKFCCHSA
jgi:hypothetical protein